jgi:hypothetical protein
LLIIGLNKSAVTRHISFADVISRHNNLKFEFLHYID